MLRRREDACLRRRQAPGRDEDLIGRRHQLRPTMQGEADPLWGHDRANAVMWNVRLERTSLCARSLVSERRDPTTTSRMRRVLPGAARPSAAPRAGSSGHRVLRIVPPNCREPSSRDGRERCWRHTLRIARAVALTALTGRCSDLRTCANRRRAASQNTRRSG